INVRLQLLTEPWSYNVGSRFLVTEAGLVQQIRGQCGCERRRDNERMVVIFVAERIGISLVHVIRMDSLVADVDVRLVLFIEIVIDLHVDLTAVARVLSNAEQIVQTRIVTEPPEAGRIQSVADLIVVWKRKQRQSPIDEASTVKRNAV